MRSHRSVLRVLPIVALSFLVAGVVSGQSCASGPPFGTGFVEVLDVTCEPGPVPGTTCLPRRVFCEGLSPMNVLLRVTPPAAGVPERGTVVLGTGGGGVEFYSSSEAGIALINLLTGHGFRVVDRRWQTNWFLTGTSVKRQSCRYATLLVHIQQTIHVTGAFCVSGNSGGSAEISYALSTWGAGLFVDVAVPTSGPPMSRIDYACLNPAEWQAMCPSIVPVGAMACTPPCTVPPTHVVCSACTQGATAADLLADSVMHVGATLTYPTTVVHFLYGALDCHGPSVPLGLVYANAVGPNKTIGFVPGTPHRLYDTQAGRLAILDALLSST